MTRNLSKMNIALVAFTLTLTVCLCGLSAMLSVYHPSYAIYATKLENKPNKYSVLNNPDKYFLEAISNQHSSIFDSLDKTQIDEVTGNYGVNVIEYNGAYYETAIMFGDNFPPFMLPQTLLAGIVVSAVALGVISSFKIAIYVKRRKADNG